MSLFIYGRAIILACEGSRMLARPVALAPEKLHLMIELRIGVYGGRGLWYNGNIMITKENKTKAIAKVARNKADVGSPEVQVSILTERIKEVTEHVKNNKHDFMAKRGLIQMVGKRKKLLKYLEETDFELYKKTVKKLGLRK